MSKRIPDPFTLVIFGASGDLTRRKLIPAIYGLFRDGLLPEGFSLIGYARTPKTDDSFRAEVMDAVRTFARPGLYDATVCRAFAERIGYHAGGYDADGLRSLGARLQERAQKQNLPGHILFDLATPANVFGPIIDGLAAAGLARREPNGPAWSRIIVEKPFGSNLDTARELNRKIAAAFAESQTFRIDHYLGKETVQNILVLRFANAIFEPVWNHEFIDHVQITVSESLGVEERGGFYDQTGAIRDILQNHMMHLLSLAAMEPPLSLDANAVRDEKVKLLRSLRPIPGPCVSREVVRAQYAGGAALDGRKLPGYLDEKGVAPGSTTETYVALKAFIDNWRWEGVPFYLRTGKRMPTRVTEVGIHFKAVPHVLFNAGERSLAPNQLGIRIQPNEGIALRFEAKVPGYEMDIHPYQMDFDYATAFGKEPPDAYERLLLDAALGDSTLFIRNDEVEAAWSFLAPVLEECAAAKGAKLPSYGPGTWGPKEADALIEADGRKWEIMRRPLRRRSGAHG